MRQRLGQHFLKNSRTLEKIADALDISPRDNMIEIGPGHGELTNRLLARHPARLVAIERDSALAELTREVFRSCKNFSVVEGDAAELLPTIAREFSKLPSARAKKEKSETREYKVAGNIPYYLTGKLLRALGDLPIKPERAVFLVQREVAERICAAPPRMNLLAATVQIWAEPKIVGVVGRGQFSPPPEVDSTILALSRVERIPAARLESYFAFARALFKQPRKTIVNNLSASLGIKKEETRTLLESAGVRPDDRPERCDIETIIRLLCEITR